MGTYRSGVLETVMVPHRLREALQQEDAHRTASLLKANWEHQRHLHPSVPNPEIERPFALAEGQEALGGKAMGAGGGGPLSSLCAPEAEDRTTRDARGRRGDPALQF